MHLPEQSKRKLLNRCLPGLLLALALVFESAPAAQAEPLSAAAAINKAGRQRMLSQRVVKAYCQIGLNVAAGKSKGILEHSSSQFDAQLSELKQYSDNAEIREALAKEEQIWGQVKLITGAPVSIDGAKRLIGLSEELLQAADQATKLIEATSSGKTGQLVNIAGRQRMLSQRLAKFYMLSKWGFKQPDIEKGIEQTKKEFISAMAVLESSPQNTQQITQTLALARTQWEHFLLALHEHQSNGADTGATVLSAFASEHILEIMDKVTGLYESQAAGR